MLLRSLPFLLVLLAASAAAQIPSDDARWDARFGAPGVLGAVGAIALDTTGGAEDLYVGGWFGIAGTARASNIVRWDGASQTWDALEGGLTRQYNEHFAIRSLAVVGRSLWVAGYFRASTGTGGTAEHLARFDLDARTWSAPVAGLDPGGEGLLLATDGGVLFLATGTGLLRYDLATGALTTLAAGLPVTALAVEDGQLVVGGRFTEVGGVAARHVARYDVTAETWHALGAGVGGAPDAIEVDGATVYVGGEAVGEAGGSTVFNVATWDGEVWSGIGGGFRWFGEPAEITGLEVSPDGSLYATGLFDTAGDEPVRNAARFDGTTWQSMEVGPRGGGSLTSLAVSADGARVYVGGDTVQGTGTPAVGVARWEAATASWAALLDGSALGTPYGSVTSLSTAPDGTLYGVASGWAGTTRLPGEASQLVRWTGDGWEPVGDLSRFLPSAQSNSDQVALDLSALAFAPDGSVYAAGGTTRTYFSGGVLRYAGAPILLRWDGTAWHRLDWAGMWDLRSTMYGTLGSASSLALDGSILYVGGTFEGVFDVSNDPVPNTWNIVAYDTASGTWSEVGGGIGTGDLDAGVEALALDPLTGHLFAGGQFTTAGGNTIRSLARFDGERWNGIRDGGPHLEDESPGLVRALAITEEALFVAGRFAGAGGETLNSVGRLDLDTEEWSALGDGLTHVRSYGTADALAVRGEQVFVGGTFQQAGEASARNVAAWDGQAWGPLGRGVRLLDDEYGVSGSASALALVGDDLFVGGSFDVAGERPSLGVASYEVGLYAGAEVGHLAWANYGFAIAILGFPALEVYIDGAASPTAVLEFTSFDDLGGGVVTFPANRPFDVRFRFADETPEAWGVPQDTTITVPAIAPGYYAGNVGGIPRGARHQFAPNPEGFPLEPWLVWSRLKGADETVRRADGVAVAVLHSATDAPNVDVTVAGSGVVLANDLGYGQGSEAVTLPAAVHRVDVRRADTGEVLESVVYDLTAVDGEGLAITVGGFLNPAANMNGPALAIEARSETGTPTDGVVVTGTVGEAPDTAGLRSIGPNPTAARAAVRYRLAEPADVRVELFDALGRRVAVVAAGRQAAGSQEVVLDAAALDLPSGTYVVRVGAGAWSATGRFTVVR